MRTSFKFNECTATSKNGKIGKSYFGISLFLVTLFVPTNVMACHHYARWYYPYPQHCGRGETGRHMGLKIPQREAMRVQTPPSAPEDKDWYVEVTKFPADIDDTDPDADIREVGIEKLKQLQK
jgi:hypothetical protein